MPRKPIRWSLSSDDDDDIEGATCADSKELTEDDITKLSEILEKTHSFQKLIGLLRDIHEEQNILKEFIYQFKHPTNLKDSKTHTCGN